MLWVRGSQGVFLTFSPGLLLFLGDCYNFFNLFSLTFECGEYILLVLMMINFFKGVYDGKQHNNSSGFFAR